MQQLRDSEIASQMPRIPAGFIKKFGEKLGHDKCYKYYNKYIEVLQETILPRLPYMRGNTTYISTKKLIDKCGTFQCNNKRYYLYNELHRLQPFFMVLRKGSNLHDYKNHFMKNSEVKLNYKNINYLIDICDAEKLVELVYGDIKNKNIKFVEIDHNSLCNFIDQTMDNISLHKNEINLHEKLVTNLYQAKYLKMISEYFYDDEFEYVIPMIENPSPYGRMYYEGINLQNVNKEVRIAAIGDHYQYDINAAVFAIKLMYAMDILKEYNIDHDGFFTYTKEYLLNKDHIRNNLSKHIIAYVDGTKLVKQAMTAIGFGAKTTNSSWMVDNIWHTTSISEIIKNKTDRDNFLNDPWLQEFVSEQEKLTDLIVEFYLQIPNWAETHLANLPRVTDKRGKYKKKQVMTYLFQKAETIIMQEITKHMNNVYLVIHDACITTMPVIPSKQAEIKSMLSYINPYLSITIEEYNRWYGTNYQQEILDHISRIEIETRHAENYKSVFVETDDIPVIKRKYVYGLDQNDSMCYDSYSDEGRQYEQYDNEHDDMVKNMTPAEKAEHYRIVGYNPNKLPDQINKLLEK